MKEKFINMDQEPNEIDCPEYENDVISITDPKIISELFRSMLTPEQIAEVDEIFNELFHDLLYDYDNYVPDDYYDCCEE